MGEKLDQLQAQYSEKLSQKEELRKKSEDMELKLDRADKLVSGLAGERERWEKTVEVRIHKHTHAHVRAHTLVETGKYLQIVYFCPNAGSGGGHGLSSRRLSTGCCVSLIHGSFLVQLQR